MKNRILALVTAAVLCLFSGCGTTQAAIDGSEQPVQSESAGPSAEAEAPESEQSVQTAQAEPAPSEAAVPSQEAAPAGISYPIENPSQDINLWTTIQSNVQTLYQSWNDHYILPYAEEATGVTLVVTDVPFESQSEQFSLMVASGQWPDVLQASLYNGGLSQALADEFVTPLTDDMLAADAPDYYAKLLEKGGAAVKNAQIGGVYPGVYTISDQVFEGRGMMVRADWLRELGLEVPSTLDAFTDALYAIKDRYGTQFTFWLENDADMAFINAAFNTNTCGYLTTALPKYVTGGTVYCPWATDEYRAFVQWFAGLYADGIFDKEFYNTFSNSPADRYGYLVAGKIGVYEDSFSSINDWKRYAGDENAIEVEAIPDLLDENGGNTWGEEKNPVGMSYSITTTCADPDLVLKYWNYFFTDAGIVMANYGVEGKSFDYDADGGYVYTDDVLNNQYNLSYRAALGVNTMSYLVPYYSIESKLFSAYGENAIQAMELFNPDYQTAEHYYPSGAALTTEESAAISTKVSDICTYAQETLLRFMTGEDPVTGESWSAFVGQMNTLGLQDCVAVYQAAYDDYLANAR